LIDVKGMFFGTTLEGGRYGRHCYFGCGAVFSLTAQMMPDLPR